MIFGALRPPDSGESGESPPGQSRPHTGQPAFNRTRDDSPLTPCPECASLLAAQAANAEASRLEALDALEAAEDDATFARARATAAERELRYERRRAQRLAEKAGRLAHEIAEQRAMQDQDRGPR